MSYELIALLMFASMMLLLATGQRVFGAIGFVATAFALALWGEGGFEMPFNASFVLLNWYPLVTLPLFIYMGYMLAESGIADDLYRMFHVWAGPVRGGLAIGTIGLMVVIAAMNGLSVAGMAIGATHRAAGAAAARLRQDHGDGRHPGRQHARHPGPAERRADPLWHDRAASRSASSGWPACSPASCSPACSSPTSRIRCWIQPDLGPPLPLKERQQVSWGEKFRLLGAGIVPLLIFFSMTGLFLMGVTSLVESSAVGAAAATITALLKGRLNWQVMERHAPPDAERQLHVHVDHPGRDVLRRRVRRPRRRARDPVPVPGRVGTRALGSHHPDAAQLSHHGHVPRRHCHAGDRRPALCAVGDHLWDSIRSGTACCIRSVARSLT